MDADRMQSDPQNHEATRVQGELSFRLSWGPLRALAILSGIYVVKGILAVIGRYALSIRRRATLELIQGKLVLDAEWTILGRPIRQVRTVSPAWDVDAVRFENRQRYLYLLVGFGALAVGTWLGIQWFVDGLRAGYPYLALVGAGVVAAGVVIDLVLYLLVPPGKGLTRLIVKQGPWFVRMSGVEREDVLRLVERLYASSNSKSMPPGESK